VRGTIRFVYFLNNCAWSLAVVTAINTPGVREKLVASGSEPVGNTPEEFLAHVRRELARWDKVIRDNNIRAE
jgi:tripartite-type tricarboxylate transporter receptor subunit TctC